MSHNPAMLNTDLVYIANDGSFGDARGLIVARVEDFNSATADGVDLLLAESESNNNIYQWAYRVLIGKAAPKAVTSYVVDESIVLDGREWVERMQKNINTLLGWKDVAKTNQKLTRRERKRFTGKMED
jgi:hypothetical protein